MNNSGISVNIDGVMKDLVPESKKYDIGCMQYYFTKSEISLAFPINLKNVEKVLFFGMESTCSHFGFGNNALCIDDFTKTYDTFAPYILKPTTTGSGELYNTDYAYNYGGNPNYSRTSDRVSECMYGNIPSLKVSVSKLSNKFSLIIRRPASTSTEFHRVDNNTDVKSGKTGSFKYGAFWIAIGT